MPQTKREDRPELECAMSILAGGAVAAGVCLLVLALWAWLTAAGRLGPDWLDRARLVGAFVGCLAGGGLAAGHARRRALLQSLGAGLVFLLLCLLSGRLTGAGMWGEGSASLLAAALLGGGLAGVLFAPDKKRRK